jgi:hypothetical protein
MASGTQLRAAFDSAKDRAEVLTAQALGTAAGAVVPVVGNAGGKAQTAAQTALTAAGAALGPHANALRDKASEISDRAVGTARERGPVLLETARERGVAAWIAACDAETAHELATKAAKPTAKSSRRARRAAAAQARRSGRRKLVLFALAAAAGVAVARATAARRSASGPDTQWTAPIDTPASVTLTPTAEAGSPIVDLAAEVETQRS